VSASPTAMTGTSGSSARRPDGRGRDAFYS
jgi:hypothetical protein